MRIHILIMGMMIQIFFFQRLLTMLVQVLHPIHMGVDNSLTGQPPGNLTQTRCVYSVCRKVFVD